jgi:hypothetical protein
MSHFAEIDSNGIVQRVIVAEQDFINSGLVGDSFNWVQTSFNSNFRKQFAGTGFTWDKTNEVFVAPTPYASWTLDGNHDWQPPAPKPDGDYLWNEGTKAWDEVII